MGHIEAKQSHGLPAECPLCIRRILGVEKNTTASKLFQLIKKIDKQIVKQPPVENPQPVQVQDDPILEAIKEENMKVKRELEGTPSTQRSSHLVEKNSLLERKLDEIQEFENTIRREKEQREKATAILEFQLAEQQKLNQREK